MTHQVMTMAQARELNAQGKLARKVMTEQGWYIPEPSRVIAAPPAPVASPTLPAPLLLPPVKARKVRKGKGA